VRTRDDARIVAEMHALGGTDAALLQDPEVLQMILPTLRSDYRVIDTYRWPPDGPPPCPVTVLTGDRDPHTTVEGARDWARHSREPFDVESSPAAIFTWPSRPPRSSACSATTWPPVRCARPAPRSPAATTPNRTWQPMSSVATHR